MMMKTMKTILWGLKISETFRGNQLYDTFSLLIYYNSVLFSKNMQTRITILFL